MVVGLILGFFDHNFAGKPWFAQTNAKEQYSLEIDVGTIDLLKNVEVPWGDTTEAKAMMKNINDSDNKEFIDAGEHNIPFWACHELQQILSDVRSGWQKLWFTRTYEMGKNQKGETVEINEAEFGM